jgi:hypothetical protein
MQTYCLIMFFYYTIFWHSDTVKNYHLTRKTSQVTEIFPILKDSTNQTHRSLFEVFGAVRVVCHETVDTVSSFIDGEMFDIMLFLALIGRLGVCI